ENQRKIEDLVRSFYPGAEAFVFVHSVLDLDRKGSDTREMTEGQILRQVKDQRTASSTEGPENQVGANPNVARLTPTGESGRKTEETTKGSDTSFKPGERVTYEHQTPGKVENITVSVVMHLPPVYETNEDGTKKVNELTGQSIPTKESQPPLTDEELADLQKSVTAAVGLKSVRDVEIRQVPFLLARATIEKPKTTGFLLRDVAVRNFAAILLALMLLVVMVAIFLQVRRVIPSEEFAALEEEVPEAPPPAFEEMTEDERANATFEQMRDRIAGIVSEDPKKAASLVKRWLVME
ncbi:MAG: flagellar M-ring protein FliF C-terminal domain-containing protein, partial [Planctomycetota bacterium]